MRPSRDQILDAVMQSDLPAEIAVGIYNMFRTLDTVGAQNKFLVLATMALMEATPGSGAVSSVSLETGVWESVKRAIDSRGGRYPLIDYQETASHGTVSVVWPNEG